ncbi:MAG: tRNA (N(6)-L-threonylcarbamoyladenosine(37)-C(2))-methylthiotransferase MtaB, partial [Chloroflexi bacterium]|nr:tRNA (N(6)-L-threonylcarbamoyladenosine(37)-C(2))-methylthiotransferase MtaB [Chloroflexota bacterium]
MRVALDTLGCKLNQAETEILAGELTAAGFTIVYGREAADIYVLNTCSVTAEADRKARQLLRAAKRRNPKTFVVAVGCYGQWNREALLKVAGVDMVLGSTDKFSLPQLLVERHPKEATFLVSSKSKALRSRSFVKIQDGCDAFCAYCIVPYLRTVKNCLPVDEIISRINKRVEEGYKEVVLTGTEIGNYQDSGVELIGLIERILDETNIERLRLSSLQPQHIDSRLLALWQNERLCRHFHISLQSGSDGVLSRMKRRYNIATYRWVLTEIRHQLPDAAVTTDVIVGFPAETEEEFKQSYAFCQQMAFSRIHVFPYSARPATAAAKIPNQVNPQVKKERAAKMLKLADTAALAFRESYLGKQAVVLWERETAGYWSGYTSNYIKVYVKSAKNLVNTITKVTLKDIGRDEVRGISSTSPAP